MKNYLNIILIVAVLFLSNFCLSQNYIGDKDEINCILKNNKAFSKAYITANYDALANAYRKEGIILPPGADITKDREAIKKKGGHCQKTHVSPIIKYSLQKFQLKTIGLMILDITDEHRSKGTVVKRILELFLF